MSLEGLECKDSPFMLQTNFNYLLLPHPIAAMLRRKQLILVTLFALAGGSYFGAFSQLEITPFLKGYIAIIPLQILALLYVLYVRLNRRSEKLLEQKNLNSDSQETGENRKNGFVS